MEISKLKKVPLSYLSYLALDPSQNSFIRDCAKEELRNRLQNVDIPVEKWLKSEGKVFQERGFALEHYLFAPAPNMQLLMEVTLKNDPRTFSELHLCPRIEQGENSNHFYNQILKYEIKNINAQMEKSVSPREKENLKMVQAYLQHLLDVQDLRKKDVTYNSSLCYLWSLGEPYAYGANLSFEEQYRISSSKLGLLRSTILEKLDEKVLKQEPIQEAIGFMRVLSDESRLTEQRSNLYFQARTGFTVDYTTDAFQKVLKSKKMQ